MQNSLWNGCPFGRSPPAPCIWQTAQPRITGFFLEYQSVFSEQRIADTVAPLAWGYCHFPYAALTSLNVARYSFPSDFNINVLSYDRLLTTIKILTKGLHLRSVSTCNDFWGFELSGLKSKIEWPIYAAPFQSLLFYYQKVSYWWMRQLSPNNRSLG